MSMKNFLALAFAGVVGLGPARAAVEPGENLLLNGALEADQVDWPSGWRRNRVEALKYLPSGGPDGRGCASSCFCICYRS